MKIKQTIENGNVFKPHEPTNESFNNSNGWPTSNIEANNSIENSRNYSNCNAIYGSTGTAETFVNYTTAIESLKSNVNVEFTVCNRQFRINAQKNSYNNSFKVNNLEEDKNTKLTDRERSKGKAPTYFISKVISVHLEKKSCNLP